MRKHDLEKRLQALETRRLCLEKTPGLPSSMELALQELSQFGTLFVPQLSKQLGNSLRKFLPGKSGKNDRGRSSATPKAAGLAKRVGLRRKEAADR